MPIQSFAGFDSVASILTTLQQLESGYFRQPAILADATSRDDRIDGVLRTRAGALLASELDFKPANDSDQARKIAEMVGGTEDAPGKWDEIVPPGVELELLRSGYLLNFGLAEVLWTWVDGMVWPRLKFWDTQFVRWDWLSMGYKLLTLDAGEVDLPTLDVNTMGDGQWFVHTPLGYQYAWRRGMLRSLAGKFLMRQWSYRDFARFCEVHGLCLVKAIVPGDGGDDGEHQLFLAQVANRGSEPVILTPQGADGNKYDVQYVEAVALTWKSFGDFIDRLNTDIAVMVLGQNLTTEAAGGGLGGGEAKTHNLVRLDKAREDAMIADAFYHQILKPWAKYNFGDPALAPRPIYRVGPPEDLNSKATALKTIGEAVISLTTASDYVDARAILDEFGVVLLTDEEVNAVRAVRAEQDKLLGAQQEAKNGSPDGSGGAGSGGPVGGKPGGSDAGDKGDNARYDGESAQSGAAALSSGQVVARYRFQDLPIAVENPRGSVRQWTDVDGTKGETAMLHDYGFIEGHVGNDGEEIDCYVGPHEGATHAYIVHQMRTPDFTRYDEDKVMLGFHDGESAKQAYLAHRTDPRSFKSMSVVPMDAFKLKLKRRTGTGRIRASSDQVDQTFAAIMAFSERAAALRAAAPAGKRDYPDALSRRAVSLAARALAPDLAGLKADIKDASTFDQMRDLIVKRYRTKMSPDELAQLIQRTRIMANMAGRLAVRKEARVT